MILNCRKSQERSMWEMRSRFMGRSTCKHETDVLKISDGGCTVAPLHWLFDSASPVVVVDAVPGTSLCAVPSINCS